ncbi:hypothetical protein FRX31_007844 [Thalictrum thalictroides]|uniref:Uncharacterized protein n=1 Tax=Thalictrum thalictroides TaxID=46969 RepID=A0A7J6X1B3_THATH|nr:hypothetical protein FRX31_007844 [Thalictrum thalictroides]
MCGGKTVSQQLREHLENNIIDTEDMSYTVQDVAELATKWLIFHTNKEYKKVENPPPVIGEMPSKQDADKYKEWKDKNPEYKSWEKKYNRWFQQYKCTASFIFGLQAKTPKVYVVSSKYEVPVDISKNFSLDQYITGITRAEVELVGNQTSFLHIHVLGSSRPLVRSYIEKSEYFKRVVVEKSGENGHREITSSQRQSGELFLLIIYRGK